jgi:hypothetical protein
MHRPVFLALLVALIALNVPTATVSAQEDPASVILRFQDARNRGDVETAMAFVAPDLVYTGSATCPPESACIGTEALRHDLDQFSADQEYSSSAAGPDVSGMTVRIRFAFQSPARSAIGLDRTLSDVTATVQDGHLTSWQSVSVWTDTQTAWWLDHELLPQ